MKITHLFFAFFVAFGLAFSFSACDNGAEEANTTDGEATEQTDETQNQNTGEAEATETHQDGNATTSETDQSGPEYTSKYVCPMHCPGSGSAEPGKCPKCGMDYVMNENYQEEGAMEGDGHEGHNH